jgi:hypothetical protein
MLDLETAFGPHLIGRKEKDKFVDVELAPILAGNPTSPTVVVQARFAHPDLKTTFLQSIGLSPAQVAAIPSFTAFVPDIILIRTPAGDEIQILPNGDTAAIKPTDRRRALLIADIKHAGEANSSYSSEVVLYAVLLANWLRLHDLEDSLFVADHLGLWTRAKEISDLANS